MDGYDSYEQAKELARHGNGTDRTRVAARTDLPPEMLYFLARDPDPAVRRAVAANSSTPPQADAMLARDADYDVRCALAHKVVGDGLEEEQRRNLWRMGFTILETLAVDQVVRVRKILSRAFERDVAAPRGVVLTLARDTEPEVAEPILENSPVLTEGDLIEIVTDGAPPWARKAIVRRPELPRAVTEAVAKREHAPARKRRSKSSDTAETPEARAARLHEAGKLNDEVVALALAAGEREFVTVALALRAGVSPSIGRRIVASRSAKAVTALVWKGKFPMRFALEVQRRLSGISSAALIYARDGIDYPLTPKEMNWHIGLYAD